ncbi:MAG TPA: response regulator [Bryobacteraceae bacterium]|nr:response regulator [Bryobacteraceae bacterium]
MTVTRSMRILLVEDDPEQLAIREMLVAHFGFEAVAVQSVEEALAAARAQELDYALIDLRLPEESAGLRLLRELRKIQPGLRVSVLTGGSLEKLERLPERALIEEVHGKGQSSLSVLLRRLQAQFRAVTH